MVVIHPHAKERLSERGTNENEILETVKHGEQFQAKYERTGFRHNFVFENVWRGKFYNTKQLEVYGVNENDNWVIVTVITKFF